MSLSWDVYAWVGVVGTRDDLPDNDDSGDDTIGEGLRLVEFGQLNGSNGIGIAIPRSWATFQDVSRSDFDDESVETMRMPTQQERERFEKALDAIGWKGDREIAFHVGVLQS